MQDQVDDLAARHGIRSDEVPERVLFRRTAVKRLTEPDEVAATVCWLCGDHASYITGISLPIDGGWTAS